MDRHPTPTQPINLSQLLLLQRLGFRFGLDLDGQLVVRCDASADEMIEILYQHAEAIVPAVRYRERLRRSHCVGGPRNGEPHCGRPRDVIAYHLARRRWAVYEVGEDGRAWFRGWERSEKRARHKACLLQRRALNPADAGRGYWVFGSFHAIRRGEK